MTLDTVASVVWGDTVKESTDTSTCTTGYAISGPTRITRIKLQEILQVLEQATITLITKTAESSSYCV